MTKKCIVLRKSIQTFALGYKIYDITKMVPEGGFEPPTKGL